MRVLFVDDDPVLLRVFDAVIRRVSERIRFRPEFALDGRQAIDAMQRGRFDFVVSDLYMPGPSGRTVLATAKRLHPTTRRVLFTGSSVSPRTVDADVIITKPCSCAEVLDILLDTCQYREVRRFA